MNKKTHKEEELIQQLLSKKLRTYRPDVRRKEMIYQRVVEGRGFGLWLRGLQRSFAALTMGVLFLSFGLTTTFAYYSPQVNSESALYPLKLAVEDVEYSLTFQQEVKVEKLLKFNDKRKSEIAVLSEEGVEDVVGKKAIEENLVEAKVLVKEVENVKIKSNLLVLINKQEESLKEGDTVIVEEEPEVPEEPVEEVKSPIDVLVDIPAAIVLPGLSKEKEEPAEAPAEEPAAPVFENSLKVESLLKSDAIESEPEPVTKEEPVVEPLPKFDYQPVPIYIPELEKSAEPVCKNQCKPDEEQKCADGLVQYCQDYNGDGCYEWGQCYLPKYNWDFKPVDNTKSTLIK